MWILCSYKTADELSVSPREHKIQIFELTYNYLYYYYIIIIIIIIVVVGVVVISTWTIYI